MIATLRETKAKLSAMVALAESGEDVVITVRGKPRARLSAIAEGGNIRTAGWARELRRLHRKYGTRKGRLAAEAILAELREDRC
ncbi:MAG: type II toxin-antitoxin system prevent-host-death family antitoxin [Kiritimatiellae bacterium]|nr:type II toxin-antitoxin system prevent-host-death family antitoxin [Kiritimatiellia bacterium]